MKIVIAEPIHKDALKLLERYEVIKCKPYKLESHIADADAVVVRTYTTLDSKILSKAKHLKYIVRCGVGLENIDLEYCKKHDIKVINAPASNADAVAEHTVMLMLACLKNLTKLDASVRRGAWEREPTAQFRGKTVGILGFGNIGKKVAESLNGFSIKVITYDIIKDEQTAEKLGVDFVPLDDLLKLSDIITVHVPLNKKTHHLIDAKALSKMKDGVIFINTSRGAVVDETALADALKSGKVSFAGLDVFEQEPPGKGLLLELSNTILTPHVAGLTQHSFREMCIRPIKVFLEDIK